MGLILHSPAAHSLEECLRELKFGRPSREQLLLDDLVNIVYQRLGNNGPGFSPEIVGAVFGKGSEGGAEDKLIIHDKCGLPVEMCECSDAPVKYNSGTDRFEGQPPKDNIDAGKPAHNTPSDEIVRKLLEGALERIVCDDPEMADFDDGCMCVRCRIERYLGEQNHA